MSRWVAVHSVQKFRGWPPIGAVYVVFRDGRPVYVGQTCDLRRRMCGHRSSPVCPWAPMDGLVVKYRAGKRYGEWAMAELRLLRRFDLPSQSKPFRTARQRWFGMNHA